MMMPSEPEIYLDYCKYHRMIDQPPTIDPLPYEQWAHMPPYWDEIKRHKGDEFLASLHPDGGNLAGFHGVKGNEDDD